MSFIEPTCPNEDCSDEKPCKECGQAALGFGVMMLSAMLQVPTPPLPASVHRAMQAKVIRSLGPELDRMRQASPPESNN